MSEDLNKEIIEAQPETTDTSIALDMPNLDDMSPEELNKLVEASMADNVGGSVNQLKINTELMGEGYEAIVELLKTKLAGLLVDITPENNRKEFFLNIKDVIDATIELEEIESTEQSTHDLLTKQFRLAMKHFALFLSLEAGGTGLDKHSPDMYTNLIYDIFTNAEGISMLIQNFGQNVGELKNPEHRMIDMVISNPVVIGSMLGSVTLILNRLIGLKLAMNLAEGEESTDEDQVAAFREVLESL